MPSVLTGANLANRDLIYLGVSGDGDSASIGFGQFAHSVRRGVNMVHVVENNGVYGLTKGQYSPTSETGKITKSTPQGSVDYSFNPVSLALGAEATFVARSVDSDRKHLSEVLRRAAAHEGTALVEILQNCNIFNDGAGEALKDNETGPQNVIRLEDGQPIRFGANSEKVVIRGKNGHIEVAEAAAVAESDVIVYDSHTEDPGLAFAISRLSDSHSLTDTAIGVFRDVHRPSYDRLVREQMAEAAAGGPGDLQSLINGKDNWQVG
jgi:2-oxoglutarate ferredoxin oxidoreductase subunit beta